MKTEYFSIPKPCAANWNKMTPTEQGAFCGQCNKEVVDLFPVPTNQIRATLSAKNNPCIRILKSQIDELNFTEWYRSISLSKKLRYLFLFTLILGSLNKAIAQETDTTFIPYSNEYLDELELNKTHEAIVDLETLTIDTADFTKEGYFIPNLGPPIYEGWQGIHLEPPAVEWHYWNEEDVAVVGGYTLEPVFLMGDTTYIPPINQIRLNENTYTFAIFEDKLNFTYHSLKEQSVRINVKNETGEIVFFIPIRLELGKNTSSFSLEKFERGQYTITLETETDSKSTEIIYL